MLSWAALSSCTLRGWYYFLASAQLLSRVWLFATPWTATCPWDFPGRNTGVGCHFLLRGIFLTHGSNLHLLCLLHGQEDPLPLSKLGSPSGPTNPAAEVPWCMHWRRYGCLEEDCCNSCLGLVAQFTERVAHPWCPEESAGISQRVKLGLEFQAKEQPMWRVQRQDRVWCLKEAAPVCRGQDRSHSGDEQCACLCSAGLLVLPSF